MNQNKFKKRAVDASLYQNKRWKNLRSEILDETPFCISCESTFKLHVDHIFHHYNNLEFFFWKDNLQVLCIGCHNQKTNLDYYFETKKANQRDFVLNINSKKSLKKINDINQIQLNFFKEQVIITEIEQESVGLKINFNIKGLKLNEIKTAIQTILRRNQKVGNFDEIYFNDKKINELEEIGIEIWKENNNKGE